MNVPKVLADGLAKVESQKKTFKYIVVDPAKVKIDRKITPEETEQYYEDFSTNFIEPEKRDVSFIVLSIDDMAKKSFRKMLTLKPIMKKTSVNSKRRRHARFCRWFLTAGKTPTRPWPN